VKIPEAGKKNIEGVEGQGGGGKKLTLGLGKSQSRKGEKTLPIRRGKVWGGTGIDAGKAARMEGGLPVKKKLL